MLSFSDQPQQFLVELEEYLGKGPEGDTKRLKDIPVWLAESERKHSAQAAKNAVELLGTAVGKQHSWQDSFRESGILGHVVQNLDSTTPVALSKQYLRVIGNCVADNDENREVISEDFVKLVACLEDDTLRTTALAVLFNLGNDYEPAHDQAAKLRLDETLVGYLAANRISEDAIDYVVDLLTWTTEKLSPVQLGDSSSLKVFDNLLKVTSQYDEDHYQEYLAILAHYLQDPEFQQKVTTPNTLDKLFNIIVDLESRLPPEENQYVLQELATHIDPNKVASDDTNVILLVRLINSLSAMSAADAFVHSFKPGSIFVTKVKSRMLSQAKSPSTVCACVILGNLATSDQVCIDMVKDTDLHMILIKILSSEKEPAILYAAAGFMRHLTFPEVNRKILGEAGLIEACCHLLTSHNPSTRGEAAAILCKLVSNNFGNIDKVVNKALPETVVLAQLSGVENPDQPTIIYHIVTQALAPSEPLPSTTMKNPMIELGRTIIAMLRYLRRSGVGKEEAAVACQMFNTPAVARPVARLVRQRFYVDARSEGLLGLGLMAQSQEGAVCVVEELKVDSGLLEAIKEFAVDSKGEHQDNTTAGRDYQNAVVFLHGLATNGVNAMDASLKTNVHALQAELSRLMV